MIVDSNILIDVFESKAAGDISARALARHGSLQPALINLIIFAEVASRFASVSDIESRVDELGLSIVPLDTGIAFRAGTAFRDYRRRGGHRETILPDFFIGAHAERLDVPILTRDPKRFAGYFPGVRLIDPMKDSDD